MLKIILTGPESCGKTTLARQLAAHFNAPLVGEYVREFFEKKETPQYIEQDLAEIAAGQIKAEKKVEKIVIQQVRQNKINEKHAFMICDTDILTIKIWSEEKYGRCNEELLAISNQLLASSETLTPPPPTSYLIPHTSYLSPPTLYFLCSPEGIAWEADPLRENPKDRARLFSIYEENLSFHEKNYVILRGGISERFAYARDIILEMNAVLNGF
jgi:nicotinamide riboside kinase